MDLPAYVLGHIVVEKLLVPLKQMYPTLYTYIEM